MIFVLIGLTLFVGGAVVVSDVSGLGTKWREVSMSFYDRRSRRPDGYERNTRLFRLYYLGVTIFGLLILVGGLLSLT